MYNDFYSDITIVPQTNKYLYINNQTYNQLKKIKGIARIAPIVEEKVILKNQESQSIVTLTGVDTAYLAVSNINKYLIEGFYDIGTEYQPKLIIGIGIQSAIRAPLGIGIQPINIYFPNINNEHTHTLLNMPFVTAQAYVDGIISAEQDFDNKLALTNIDFMRYMLNLSPDQYSKIALSVKKNSNIKTINQSLIKLFGKQITVLNRYQQNANLFKVLKSEKWIIFAVLILLIIIASFSIIGTLTMLILDKKADILILASLGMPFSSILSIFLKEGLLLSIFGFLIGAGLGYIICFIQLKFHLLQFATNSNFILSYYPVDIQFTDFVLVCSTIMFISFMAILFPIYKLKMQEAVFHVNLK